MAPSESRGSSWFANLLLLFGSLFFVVLLFAVLEGSLRLVGIGAADPQFSRLKYQQIPIPILEPGARPDGSPVLRTNDVRLPYQSILRAKPPGSLRVFTFGGSATAGLGFSPNVTFARQLSRMLAQAYPDRPVEVMNLGIVALASNQVKQIVADAVRGYEPDLLVVYSGNNEFLEVHAEKYAQAHATWLSLAVGLLHWLSANDRLSSTPIAQDLDIHWQPQLVGVLAVVLMGLLPALYLAAGLWSRSRRRKA